MNLQQPQQGIMPDKDMMYTILADLKRTVGEYTTATTEASCPVVRTMFNELLNHSLRMQGDLYNFMDQRQMYDKPTPALKQAIDKEVRMTHQTQQETQGYISQKLGHAVQGIEPQAHIHGMNATDHSHNPNPYFS